MSKALRFQFSAALLSVLLASTAQAAGSTKDIVLDRLQASVSSSGTATTAPAQDAMAVSVLLESPDGTLSPKSTNTLFRTGDRFRIKLLASREAKVSLYNTNPRGETNPKPIWQGEVRVGLDTISPRLALTGTSGIDQLHIVMEPAQERHIFSWLGNWFRASKGSDSSSKDIQLDVQNTPSTTYVLNPNGQGLVNTLQIVHSAG
jgi:hypothetical protein